MPAATRDEDEDKPLDPEVEKVRRKMVRLLAISIGMMLIGLMAVLGAIVYKLSATDGTAELATNVPAATGAAPARADIALPAGFNVEQVSLDGGHILFFGRASDGVPRAIVVEIATGRTLADLAVAP